uniref:Chromosome 18 open reading frame 21 n=2 Tax=Microcebus murinus TaxID=30608 RepID=A0A8C5UZ82_MICMU
MRQKHYLETAARGLRDSCPGQARYLLWAYGSSHDDNSTFEETCPYCFQLLVLDNSRVRLKPKSKLTPKIQKLLNREARNYTLSSKEAKIVKKYKDSKSVLLVTCKTCNRTVKHHGKSRSFLSALKSNPATPTSKLSVKTPEGKTLNSANLSHNMSGSKGKSPALIFRTPTSEQSASTGSSNTTSKTKKHFSRLKMLLSQNESQKNPKVDFRNFLSSLKSSLK